MTPQEVNIVVLARLLREQLTASGRKSSILITELETLERFLDPEGTL